MAFCAFQFIPEDFLYLKSLQTILCGWRWKIFGCQKMKKNRGKFICATLCSTQQQRQQQKNSWFHSGMQLWHRGCDTVNVV